MAEYIDRDAALQEPKKMSKVKPNVKGEHTIPDYFSRVATLLIADSYIRNIPAADVQPVTHCKDCVYRPYYEPSDSKSASDLVFPDYRFNLCPCRVEDFWYSWMPDDDWFCAYGKRNDGET